MRLDLDLRQLQAFVEVAGCGSFRQAALQTGQSQPAVSRSIRQAEQALGARLFDRDTRRVEITPAGRELLPIAQRILREFDVSLGELGVFMAGHSGRVAVAALPSIGVALVPRAIAAFSRSHPQVHFSLLEAPADALLAMVEDGRADFGVSVRPEPHQRLQFRHLHDDPFVLVCRRDDALAARASLPWSVFRTRPCLVSAPRSSIRPVTDAVFLRQRAPPEPALEYPSVAAAGAMVAAGLGIAALPVLALQLLDMRALAAVPLARPYMSRPIGIITRVGRSLPPVARAFMETLQVAPTGAPGAP